METYHLQFDAFVSYRQADPVRYWAIWLSRALESYRTPKDLVRKKGVRPRITRVSCHGEELSASADPTADIGHALQQARCLIVVQHAGLDG